MPISVKTSVLSVVSRIRPRPTAMYEPRYPMPTPIPPMRPPVLFRRHLHQQRVVELESGLVRGVREHERDDRSPIADASQEDREAHAEHRADDEERHPAPRVVAHRAKQRRDDEDDPHRDRGDDGIDRIRALGAHRSRIQSEKNIDTTPIEKIVFARSYSTHDATLAKRAPGARVRPVQTPRRGGRRRSATRMSSLIGTTIRMGRGPTSCGTSRHAEPVRLALLPRGGDHFSAAPFRRDGRPDAVRIEMLLLPQHLREAPRRKSRG